MDPTNQTQTDGRYHFDEQKDAYVWAQPIPVESKQPRWRPGDWVAIIATVCLAVVSLTAIVAAAVVVALK